MKKTGLVIFATAAGILFFSGRSFAQTAQIAQVVPQNQTATTTVQEPDIIFKIVDENGNEMKYIMTRDEYNLLLDRIRNYEKANGITDRTNKVYLVNTKNEVIGVTEQKN